MSNRVVFGSTNLQVSPVCFGTWQLSPRFWGEQPEEQVMAAMKAAFDAGINFYDTADAYGDGLGETVLGKFIAQVPRDEVVITTKVFNHFNPDSSRYPDLSPAHIMERCEIQLKRLQVETIDVYLLHFFDQLTPLADVTETLEKLRQQGKIRHYGTSNFTLEQMRAASKFGDYSVTQPPYSLLDPAIEKEILPYCQAVNIGVMVYSPLHKGLLTGKYTGDETFDDFRSNHPDFLGERFKAIAAAVRGLQPLADKYGLTIYQLVLAATIMHPAIQVAVVGIKTAEQIQEAAGAMGKVLERQDYFAVRSALEAGNATKIKDASGKVR
jgi:aryl-alcohol dehydrogenase-like predicted oxidoreductase